MKFIIVNKETLEIKGSYEAEAKDDSSVNRSHLLAEPICKHIELPEDLKEDLVEATIIDGEIVLQKSAAKEQAQIDNAWMALRAKRDQLLLETDKYMLLDFPISEEGRIAMAAYRNALRDLPENVVDPKDLVSWPEKPQI